MIARWRILPVLLWTLGACTCQPPKPPVKDDVPLHPTWRDHVRPLLANRCVTCHSAPPQENAPGDFRLDRYQTDLAGVKGAYDMRDKILDRANRPLGDDKSMPPPPKLRLSDSQQELLRRWVRDGAPEGSTPDVPPTVSFSAPGPAGAPADESFTLLLEALDVEGPVSVDLRYDKVRGGSGGPRIQGPIPGGAIVAQWDTAVLAAGDYWPYAVVEDSSNPPVVAYAGGPVRVAHASGNTAPAVAWVFPAGGEILRGTVDLAWAASDADGDALTSSVRVGTTVIHAPAADLGGATWDTTAVADGLYRLAVRVSDGKTEREAVSGEVRVSNAATATTYSADVKPILDATCADCHTVPPANSAPSTFRLDRYDDEGAIQGAYSMRDRIYERTVVKKDMPPLSASPQPSGAQRVLVGEWVLGGAPRGDTGNTPPAVTFTVPGADGASADQAITLRFAVVDPDSASVAVSLAANGSAIAAGLPKSATQLVWDTSAVAPGSYTIRATALDGLNAPTESTAPGPVVVAHASGNTAPTVAISAPAAGALWSGTQRILWSASDPDGDALTAAIALEGGGTIASGLAGTGYDWDTRSTPDGDHRISITVSDGRAATTMLSGVFHVSNAGTSYTYLADAEPVLDARCANCHTVPQKFGAPSGFRLDQYEDDAFGNLGVYSKREAIYQRAVVEKTMPPTSQVDLTAAERAMLGDWLLGGAPKGGGGAQNLPPSVTWIEPNGTNDRASSGHFLLRWSASDPESDPLSGALRFARHSKTGRPCEAAEAVGGTLLTDQAGTLQSWDWDMSALPAGQYCVWNELSDGVNAGRSFIAAGAVSR